MSITRQVFYSGEEIFLIPRNRKYLRGGGVVLLHMLMVVIYFAFSSELSVPINFYLSKI